MDVRGLRKISSMLQRSFTGKQGQYLSFIFYYTKIHGCANRRRMVFVARHCLVQILWSFTERQYSLGEGRDANRNSHPQLSTAAQNVFTLSAHQNCKLHQ